MYFVTAIQAVPENVRLIWDSRCFGYFEDRDRALEAVKGNWADMHEGNFNFLVIEHIPQGIHPVPQNETWFSWSPYHGGHWKLLAYKPEWSNHIVNWALG